jgi:uncharacterized protein YlzI (FlbEa/FlbD family)
MKTMRDLINITEDSSKSELPVQYGQFVIWPILNRSGTAKTHKSSFGKSYASTKNVKLPDGYQIVFKQDGKDYYVNPEWATVSDNPNSIMKIYDGNVNDAKESIDKMLDKIKSGELKFKYQS